MHTLAAPYALHALDESEERSFEQHLAQCERCREDLAAFREAAAALAVAAPATAPPPGLRERIVEQARAERSNVVPLRRRRDWTVPLGAAAALAACAAIALGIWAVTLSNSLDRERSAREAEAAAVALLAREGARRLQLAGANGSVVVTGDGRAALVVDVPPAPNGKTYEAWVIDAGDPRPAGLFRGGSRPSVVRLTRPVSRGAVVAVTLERAGGVEAPTQRPRITSQPA